MEQTDNIEALMERIKEQETMYEFDRIAGIIGLTKSVAKELAARGITANAVAPGFIGTEMTKAMGEKAIEAVRGRIAMKEFGEPQDVANAVRFLASDEARYITGQVLAIDGGMSL